MSTLISLTKNYKFINMQLLTKQKCNECDGTGVVQSPIWAEFFEIENKSNRAWEQDEVDEWFRERGYGKLPPEEPTCIECEGAGEIQRWMNLEDVLVQLKLF